jgi:hypothetical protein
MSNQSSALLLCVYTYVYFVVSCIEQAYSKRYVLISNLEMYTGTLKHDSQGSLLLTAIGPGQLSEESERPTRDRCAIPSDEVQHANILKAVLSATARYFLFVTKLLLHPIPSRTA